MYKKLKLELSITMIVKKSEVRNSVERKVGKDVYQKLDKKVRKILEEAEERADANGRSTILNRDV